MTGRVDHVTVTVTASLPVVRAMLDQARRKDYRYGVLGVRAQPRWDGPPTFQHENVPVQVVPCVSALAVREALLDADPTGWLVILTDRDDADLGPGLLGHLVWHRVRNPDPWEAAMSRFSATAVSTDLVTRDRHRDLAVGLLTAHPAHGWPPAPGGVLTAGHAFAAVAGIHLGMPDEEVDASSVLAWSSGDAVTTLVADLRAQAGDVLVDAVLGWLAGRAGAAAGPLTALMTAGALTDALPLGLVAALLRDARGGRAATAHEARIRLEPRLAGRTCTDAELAAWGREATTALEQLEDPARVEHVIARADTLLVELHATPLAVASDVLRSGLTARLDRLADLVRSAITLAADGIVRPTDQSGVEAAWSEVDAHRLAATDHRARRFRAAVRLIRRLATPTGSGSRDLHALLARHRDDDGWVDAAVNDVAGGVGDIRLGSALGAVLAAVRDRRDTHDREFAAALAAHTCGTAVSPAVRHLEDVLITTVLPLAAVTPVLLVVADGMSVAVSTEVIRSATESGPQGWLEALLPGEDRRAAALAVLPTITEHSRCSLLSGRLASGGQDRERAGFAAALTAVPNLTGRLFHKKLLETTQLGMAVADEVGVALDDADGVALVVCVLNTIDDALDRSDPAGIDWTVNAVRHLAPLLERAARSGRTVVLTADHGHVVERRTGTQRPSPDISSARSRAASGPAPGPDEVLVHGPRVLAHDGRAILAVNERLRYGPLKAGYHGGAAPAESVVPLCVLVPGALPEGAGLRLAGPQEPRWWAAAPTIGPSTPTAAEPSQPELFAVAPVLTLTPDVPLVAALLRSSTFGAQQKLAGHGLPTDRLAALLTALLVAPGRRLAATAAAGHLQVPVSRLRGAVAQAQRLLNVEGYEVVRADVDGTITLDETLLREQFGV